MLKMQKVHEMLNVKEMKDMEKILGDAVGTGHVGGVECKRG